MFPGKLIVGAPGCAHAEKGGVGDGLGVGRDAVVIEGGEVYLSGRKAGENAFDEFERFLRGAMFDQHEGLAFGVDSGAVQ